MYSNTWLRLHFGCFIPFVLIVLTALQHIHGQSLILPDIILPNPGNTKIKLPQDSNDISQSWLARLPEYRRQYELAIPQTSLSIADLSLNYPNYLVYLVIEELAGISDANDNFNSPGILSPFRTNWSSNTDLILRNGYGLSLHSSINSSRGQEWHVRSLIPFNFEEGSLFSVDLGWKFNSIVSTELLAGFKQEVGMKPDAGKEIKYFGYGSGHLSSSVGTNHFQSVSLSFYGGQKWNILAGANSESRINIGSSPWFIQTNSHGQLLFDSQRYLIGLMLALGIDYASVKTFFGGQLNYLGEDSVFVSPAFNLQWRPVSSILLFARIEFRSEYPRLIETVMREESLLRFSSDLPQFSRYTVGFSYGNRAKYKLMARTSLIQGTIPIFDKPFISSVNDTRFSIEGSFAWPIWSSSLQIAAMTNQSLGELADEWKISINYSYSDLVIFVESGSKNPVMFDTHRVATSTDIVAGVGLEIGLKRYGSVAISGYSTLEAKPAAFLLKLEWRNS